MSFKILFDDDVKEMKAVQQKVDECNEGFLIASENMVRISIMEEYIDYLHNKGIGMYDAKNYVETALNRAIELYNCGNAELVKSVNAYLNDTYKKKDLTLSIANRVAKKLSTIDNRLVTSSVKGALEAFDDTTIDNKVEGLNIAKSCINRVSLDMVTKCFPTEFVKTFI
jgi:hypothetical protein